MAAAQPRDFVLDEVGNAYLRGKDGKLTAYGQHKLVDRASGRAGKPVTRGKPGGGSDPSPAVFNNVIPNGSTLADSTTFSADISDPDGIRSVSFIISYPNGVQSTSITPTSTDGVTFTSSVSGFSDGDWSWQIVVKDNGDKGGNTTTSDSYNFTVSIGGDTGGGGGTSSGVDSITGCDIEVTQKEENLVCDGHYTTEDSIKNTAGRIYFEMPTNRKQRSWAGYVCSGTAVNDGIYGISSIITAAHCVYDDTNKAFARNVLFIPNQDARKFSGNTTDCIADESCYVIDYGVVAEQWTASRFPDNIPWDTAFYVITNNDLETNLQSDLFSISFDMPMTGLTGSNSLDKSFSQALGYSYEHDPEFRYSQENLTQDQPDNWWLPRSRLSGGSSGGPWLQNGSIISVNSWGYTTSDGMAGPRLGRARTEALKGVLAQPLTHARGIIVP